MTLRQAANRVRKLLVGLDCVVKGRSESFSGFGYGDAGFVNIWCPALLPEDRRVKLEALKSACKDDPDSKIIFRLSGPSYPFGGSV